jgi:Gametolysin peptidase M11
VCRITVVDTLVGLMEDFVEDTVTLGQEMQHASTNEYGCIPIVDSRETDRIYTISLPEDMVATYSANITEGKLLVSVRGAAVVNQVEIQLSHDSWIQVIHDVPHRWRHLQENPSTIGARDIFIVRVSTTDSTPTKTLDELKSGMISMNRVSFQSQFYRCSFGQLQWRLTGGIDVRLQASIRSFGRPSQLLAEAQEAAKAKLGVDDLRNVADHVVFCQPPGTDGWIAVGAVNHWYSNFNNDYCLSLSVLMHEVGHNFGLLHSGRGGVEYGDVSGFMGYGANSETWPQKCFNGVKSWQLGWYQDRHLKVDVDDVSRPISLAAFVDYKRTSPDKPVLINIADKYFLMYNRAKGFNAETQAMQDQVTVTESTPSLSSSRAGLDVGDRFSLVNFRPGRTLVIEVCSRLDGGSAGVDAMVVSIALDRSLCSAGADRAPPLLRRPDPSDDDPDSNNAEESKCLPRKSACDQDSDCCGSDLRCIRRGGEHKCRYCRVAGKRCEDHSDCCSGGRACDLVAGLCLK